MPISSQAIDMLRKKNLVEGRKPNVFVAKDIAKDTDHKVEYSQHKGLNDQQCEALLLQALADHDSLTKQEISKLLWNILSDQLNDKQKETKINNILRKLKAKGKIINKSSGKQSSWFIVR